MVFADGLTGGQTMHPVCPSQIPTNKVIGIGHLNAMYALIATNEDYFVFKTI